MKKLFFMAVAAIAALSSCTSDNELELNKTTGKEALSFTATIEDSEATRATLGTDEDGKKYAAWEKNDQISINGKTYSAKEAGITSTFTADGEGATGDTYTAYFPASLYNGTKATLPAIQTYTAGKFNMPMYATSSTTTLAFKNLCAVLAIKVTSADIATLKSIKVASDQKMNGTFTVTDNKAVINDDKGTNMVVLESSEALTLTSEGTTFYIAIPAQTYKYLNIFLSADGETYTQAMATKKAAGLGAIARSKIFNIDYAKNATKLWEGNLFFADCNIGAKLATEYGGLYTWGGTQDARVSYTDDHNTGTEALSGTDDTATALWGSNWRMPICGELLNLKGGLLYECDCEWTWQEDAEGENSAHGLLCTGKGAYASNSIFLPAGGCYYNDYGVTGVGIGGCYWSSTPNGSSIPYLDLDGIRGIHVNDASDYRYMGHSVRAVLDEAASPAPPAPEYPEGSRGKATRTGGSEVNWVQLWSDGPKFAEFNVGATSATETGSKMMTLADATKTGDENVWGANWCTPSKEQMNELLLAAQGNGDAKVTCVCGEVGGIPGFTFTGKGYYAGNSVFFPAEGGSSSNGWGNYFASGDTGWIMYLNINILEEYGVFSDSWWLEGICEGGLVRPVLRESAAPPNQINGHAYVELAGYKWATENVGAAEGVTPAATDETYGYYYKNASKNTLIAAESWGSDWTLPTVEQYQALIDGCTWTWKDSYPFSGKTMSGYLVSDKNDTSKFIFFPAAGWGNPGTLSEKGTNGYYASSTSDTDFLMFNQSEKKMSSKNAFLSFSVRPVLKEK